MNAFDSYRMFITPLSPVHIGTGESYEPTNYVIEDDVLHEFDTGSVVDALSAGDRKALLDIASRRPDTEMIKAIQRYFHDRREQLIPWAVNRIPVLPGVANLYASRIGQTANREANGGQVLNRMEIDRTSYNPITRLPVLFGSSMKGAIRTALLDGVNDGAGLQNVEDRRTGKRRDENNLELQQRLFQYWAGKFELDPMRLVQLSDAAWQGEPGLPAAQVHLAVNRKKAPVKDERGNLRKARADELYQILECIPGWRYRAFAGQINLQSVAGIANQDRKGQSRLPAEDLRFDMAQIAHACNDFYKPILESENQLMRERGYLDDAWGKSIAQFLKVNDERMRRGDVFLLRVGRHSGAESVTLRGARDGHIKIMLDKDTQTKKQRYAYESEARTLWLAADTKDQSTKLLPFGWILVDLQPMDAPLQDWPELKDACEPHLANARSFAAKLATKQTEIEQARQVTEAKRREEAEQERLRGEEEKRRQQEDAERQERLANMSPNLQRIEKFKADFSGREAQLRGKKDRQNTDYHDRARKLAKDALESAGWTAEEKRAVAEAIAEWLPRVVEDAGKDRFKEQFKKLRLVALRDAL